MKTRNEVLEAIKTRKSQCIDGRDYARLANFFPKEHLEIFGFELKEGVEWDFKEWSLENFIKQLETDVAFGFEKALNKRGISSSLIYKVVKMWLWILDDELIVFSDYAMYGLPLFKAVALKYSFENPIGEDSGSELKYEEY